MDRRTLLGAAAGLGLFAPVIPAWLKAGFQQGRQGEGVDPASGSAPGAPSAPGAEGHCANPYVRSTLDRAERLGKPTLVFVVPEQRQELWSRQLVFGQFLNYCSPEALFDLSLCEVLCASQADLAVHVPEAQRVPAPLMLLVGGPGGLIPLRADLPWVPTYESPMYGDEGNMKERVLARVAAIEERLHGALSIDDDAVSHHARFAEQRVGSEVLARIEEARQADGRIDPRLADEAAALVLERSRTGANAAMMRDQLIRGTAHRLREGPPFGAVWAGSMGCGATLEKVPEDHPAAGTDPVPTFGMMCGMAHSPEVSRRFLSFWGNPLGD